ncbi:UDP-N-acetylmuramate dehydrogenase [Pseudobacteroides cellulosolvens]|uniref:UDP-N-acetylenolpyruvoylglucosamine reductase n=1 Tax=Pseudobacteroides cellulosolvens ATCC 35603 = DSM 2933 TaxID=398512 RepID=A0A0L6JRY2_9FIRM|nr:UDP-N-acetylmuramate dehydrogenase [Pseudobacteroides cellulosolvens]KNY28596.1 UDP-N-acetylenolpyruvoylglucosamine reductase [Pseudobacteroides cellulosolvens ATCC 35603 = DSM 2933]
MDIKHITELLVEAVDTESVKNFELMSKHTSFKIGGPADILVTPKTAQQLVKIIEISKAEKVPIFIMGNGSNLIVREKGIRGITVKLFDNFDECEVTGCTVKAQAGILLSRLSQIAFQNGLTGLEFASGIPGTLGGAIAMNAGAYGGEMKDVVVRTRYIDKSGAIKSIEGDMHCFGYRTSFIQNEEGIVLDSELRLNEGDKNQIKALMDDLCKKRNEKQPLKMPSAGSVFKRPEGYFAGKLVEDCGLRGYSIGGAEVSNLHCGFIVNKGNAVAGDVIALIEFIKSSVKDKFGVELQTEIKIVGEE